MKILEPIVIFDATCFLYIHGSRPDYKESLHAHILSTLNAFGTDKYIGIIDGKGNFRKDVDTGVVYKGQRKTEKPPYFYEIMEHLIQEYNFFKVNNVEADDLAATLANIINTEAKWNEVDIPPVVIASIDKDLTQVEGLHYNLKTNTIMLVTDSNCYLEMTPNGKLKGNGYKLLYAQMLMGDAADNIKGLPKYGPVKSYNLLKDCTTREQCKEVVLREYVNVYGDAYLENLQGQFSLVYILRNCNIPQSIPIRTFFSV